MDSEVELRQSDDIPVSSQEMFSVALGLMWSVFADLGASLMVLLLIYIYRISPCAEFKDFG